MSKHAGKNTNWIDAKLQKQQGPSFTQLEVWVLGGVVKTSFVTSHNIAKKPKQFFEGLFI